MSNALNVQLQMCLFGNTAIFITKHELVEAADRPRSGEGHQLL